MNTAERKLIEHIERRLRSMSSDAAQRRWGGDESLEAQALQLLEIRNIVLRPTLYQQDRLEVRRVYQRFVTANFGEVSTMMWALLSSKGESARLPGLIGRLRELIDIELPAEDVTGDSRLALEVSFKREYRSGSNDIDEEFFAPALRRATQYWRAIGFFSSGTLETVGLPLRSFSADAGSMRLITALFLGENDIRAIASGIDRESVCEARLLNQIRTEFIGDSTPGLSLVATLLEFARLEIRLAIPRVGYGIYHEKVGVFLESNDVFVAFSGGSSENTVMLSKDSQEGSSVPRRGYECLDVYPSWTDPERAASKRAYFERVWEGEEQGIISLPFPEIARQELLRACQGPVRQNYRTSVAKSPPNRWKHQEHAVAAFLVHKHGVLEMATGTGKTRTALNILRTLVERRSIDSAIITTDGTDLLEQWSRQLFDLAASFNPVFRVHRQFGKYHEREEYELNPQQSILIVSRPNLHLTLKKLSARERERIFLIHDEIHRLGSPANQANLQSLSDAIVYKLGLSATPEREYDSSGTAFIERHVGPVIFRFGLPEAIRAGILCEFDYYPIEFELTREDREAKNAVFKKAAARAKAGSPMSAEEKFTALAVDKLSRAKLPLFEKFLEVRPTVLDRCIVFVEEKEYGDEVCRLIHAHRHEYHTYYAEDDRSNLDSFANGDITCLITCHRLSEGIDVHSIRSVVLFASNRTRLETIQRMGRCLRVDPNDPGKRAIIVDFVKAMEVEKRGIAPSAEEVSADQLRKRWLDDLASVRRDVHAHLESGD